MRIAPRGWQAGWVVLLLMVGVAQAAAPPGPVSFDRDIRPLLSETCFRCHGPDQAARQADLRLDQKDKALATGKSGKAPIVPGQPDQSEAYRRISSTDPDDRMPPKDSPRQLKASDVQLIRRWIEQGANWQDHWAFRAPNVVTKSKPLTSDWVNNGIDEFVLRQLQSRGLRPSRQADKRQLLRRVTFDLTGLPPTRDEINNLLADDSPDAYERVVDRLLRSPRYGERMAVQWLDAARYADTHGFALDTERSMWRWRDWVIDAFNQNMPFDQFTIEQLAGDLLPEATASQKIATGFNRNHVINSEFGAIPDEYLAEYLADRVSTTATVWLGLTMECARCHDHKYDPITQREFYEFLAFFNTLPEQGLDGLVSNAVPNLSAPTPDQSSRLAEISSQLTDARKSWDELRSQVEEAQAKWEQMNTAPVNDIRDGLLAYWPFDKDLKEVTGIFGDKFVTTGGAIHGGGLIGKGSGYFGFHKLVVPGELPLRAETPFTMAAWIRVSDVQGRRSIFTQMPDGIELGRGLAFQTHDGRPTFSLVHQFPGNQLTVEGVSPVAANRWQHIAVTYDGSSRAAGVHIYVDGVRQPVKVVADTLAGPIDVDEVMTIGDGTPNAGMKGAIDEARIYSRALTADEVSQLPGLPVASLVNVPPKERTPDLQIRLLQEFLRTDVPDRWREVRRNLDRLEQQHAEAQKSVPTVMVMQEQPKPKATHLLIRGAYDRPGEVVTAGTPRFLPTMSDDLPKNRLGLARWLVSNENPLTARVIVNRYWQMYFGTGLVKSAEDFGSQGDRPSHPELLDWLASEFIRSGWNVRELQRLIVTSATYRQSSRANEDDYSRDPENRLLARGPRLRLEAEMIRDQALAVSGLLAGPVGGPSVKPYQPSGLWEEGAFDPTGNRWSAQAYRQDHGSLLYRRSMYTFWKRTSPPPAMQVFDVPDRDRCVVSRDRSNTPLQALVLMNDSTYLEASRKLAERMLKEGGQQDDERIAFAFEAVTARTPSAGETTSLQALLARQRSRFRVDPAAAGGLLAVGESAADPSLDSAELAACTAVANVLLTLDEALTKN